MKQYSLLICELKTEKMCICNYSDEVEKNYDENILKEIVHIKFPQLKLLSLRDNKIRSIEFISRIWLPAL